MNKTLVAAISGVVFGATLTTAAVIQYRSSVRRHCAHRTVIVKRQSALPARPVPAPKWKGSSAERSRTESACPRLVHHPLPDVDEQLTEAQSEYVNGNYACAQSMAWTAVKQSPTRAWRIIAASACNRRDLETINLAERHLDAPGRQYMHYVCGRSGVIRTKHGWVLAN